MTFGRSSVWLALCAVAALLSNEGYAFLFPSAPLRSGSAHSSRVAPVHMGWFDAVKKGFENEEMSQPAPNAGLKNGPPTVSITFMPAGKQVTAVAGQSLKDVAQAARIPIKYNCKKGECGTCEVVLNGKKVRTCVGIVPRGARKNEVTIKVPN
ncbi:hypothetical protein NSK_003128 [Nannochloropsis salina CCMP1776]|uniref:2Fe-2S ferredoxin-type domain-containing protein n=1 Tax=Nannochloropsis salina CCMP1776 TaxID=1027361 RepID=A0A4D9DAQ6_9STRA|nr:hypothetical protein NSK_003128 [Nannochloropsis salina CCMP1776]|eukprot:TFJ85619.1 hypothetical protein NSK_003128 [Nannochloropsis salina CCMP1776]